jgi:hypothetical protein
MPSSLSSKVRSFVRNPQYGIQHPRKNFNTTLSLCQLHARVSLMNLRYSNQSVSIRGRQTSRLLTPVHHNASYMRIMHMYASSSHSPAPCVGIDLGTTSSAVALIGPDGRATVKAVVPSVVHYRPDGHVLIGQDAMEAGASAPASTFYSIKRLMGRSFREVESLLPGLSYQVREWSSMRIVCSQERMPYQNRLRSMGGS